MQDHVEDRERLRGRRREREEPNWDSARCRQAEPDTFFPEKGGSTREAKRLCNGDGRTVHGECPIKADCLDWALERGERFGIWGGMSERERRKLERLG